MMVGFRVLTEEVVRSEAELMGFLTDWMWDTGEREESRAFPSFWSE